MLLEGQIRRAERGLSIVELLIVILTISIVGGIALMNRAKADTFLKRENVSRELKVAFERARFDSVKRRGVDGTSAAAAAEAYVRVTSTSYTLRTYTFAVDGTAVAQDQVTNIPADIVIAGYGGATIPQDVTFNMRGETSDSPLPQFYICNSSCSTPTNTNADILVVTRTGTVTLLAGGSGLPSFGTPSLTTVTSTTGINEDAVIVP